VEYSKAHRKFHGAKVVLANQTDEDLPFLQKFTSLQELSPFYAERHQPSGHPRKILYPEFRGCKLLPSKDREACRAKLGVPSDAFLVLSVAHWNERTNECTG